MSIIALTIAPMISGSGDWENAKYGVIPLAVMIIGTYVVYHFFWRNHEAIAVVDTGKDVQKDDSKGEDDEKVADNA